jgi:uncharacterized protein (TIGR02145 family)
MMQVELRSAGNQLLQLSQPAKLTMPIPTVNAAITDPNVPLWYLEETTGLWKQEGVANKVGNTFEGEVNHFSAWNCDFPHHGGHFECHVEDNGHHPLPNVEVEILDHDHADLGCGHGFTDDEGNIEGYAPEGTNLRLRVYPGYYNCTNTIYDQPFIPGTSNIQITADPSNYFAQLIGNIIDCNNNPVTNGRIILKKENHYECYTSSSSGSFDFQTYLCNGAPVSTEIYAQDLTNNAQSFVSTQMIHSGVNQIATQQACGTAMTVCNQIWKVENLDVSTFRNGVVIPEISDSASWANTTGPAWCWHNFDSTTNHIYGKLYNWYAVNATDNLAPIGWHIPTKAEWDEYTDCLGGYLFAGTKMKESGFAHWWQGAAGKEGNNSSGFKGLPGGYIVENGVFYATGPAGYFWTKDANSTTDAFSKILFYNGTDLGDRMSNKKCGFSVRCLKD